MAMYGSYLRVKQEDIVKAKEQLTEQMLDTLEQIAMMDAFWIVKSCGDGYSTVGWKIDIPYMKEDGNG